MTSGSIKQVALYMKDFAFNTSGWLRHSLLYYDGIARFCPAPQYRSVYNSFSQHGIEADLVRWRYREPKVKAMAEELEELEQRGVLSTFYFRNDADKSSYDSIHQSISAKFKQTILDRGIRGTEQPLYNRLTDADFIGNMYEQMKRQNQDITEEDVAALAWDLTGVRREVYEKQSEIWYHVVDDSVAGDICDFLRSRDIPSSVQRMSTDTAYPPVVRMPAALWHIYTGIHHRLLIERQVSDSVSLIEGTDNCDLVNGLFGEEKGGQSCLKISLRDILPVPKERISLLEIADFRKKRHGDLLRLRTLIERLQADVSKAQKPSECEDIVNSFRTQCDNELQELRADLKYANIEIWRSSVSYFVSTVGGVVGAAMSGSPLLVALAAAVGAVGVESTWAKVRQRDRIGRKSPYTYLFQVWREGMTAR